MKNFRKNQGITLIALVITVIVLLILAGITITTLTGDNGILNRVQEAKNETEQAEKDEKEKIGDMEDIINEYTTGIEIEQVTDENPGVLEGTGTEADPYTINSIEDLVVFASNVREGTTYEGQTVKLGLSLDFNSNKSYVDPLRTDYGEYGYDGELKTLLTTGEGFKPIGTEKDVINDEGTNITSNYCFNGIFDGSGKIIKNLYMNKKVLNEETSTRVALFGFNGGTITNLGVVDTKIYTNNNIFNPAGIAGQNNSSGIIQKCYTSGTIVCSANNAGGISTWSSGTITDCYNSINIQSILETDLQDKEIRMGGIASSSSSTGTISNCYNIGKIECTATADNGKFKIGGIVGMNGNINNCYNMGNIILNAERAQSVFLGGISGHMDRVLLENCCNTGRLSGKNDTDLRIGGIVGYRNQGTLTLCYYLKDIAEKGVGYGSDDTILVEKKLDMPDIISILGSEFKEDTNNINNGYPILTWQ